MIAPLTWYLAVQVLGTLAFVLAAPFLRALPDSGYASSKALGVFLFGFILWVGTSLGALRNEPGGAVLVIVVMSSGAALIRFRHRRASPRPGQGPVPLRLHVVAATELLFLAAFAGWCLVRYADPAVSHTEQPMDLMLLTAISSSPTLPVEDPWLAGFPIGYYYLGHWLMSGVGHLTGLEPAVAYNVGQASWFGLLVCTCFGIGYNLARLCDPAEPGAAGRSVAMASGSLAAVTVALAGNLVLPIQWIAAAVWRGGPDAPSGGWWWWSSSRAVRDVDLAGNSVEIITEFPFFSYLLGDNHPHVLAMPFVALTISLGLALFVEGRRVASRPAGEPPFDARVGPGALAVLSCAGLVSMNTWDLPAVFLLLASALLLPLRERPPVSRRSMRTAVMLSSIAVLAILLVNVPYLLTAQSQVRGVLPNLFHPTRASEFAVVFGLLAPGVVLLLHLAWIAAPPPGRQLAAGMAGGLAACALWLAAGGLWARLSPAGNEWLTRVARGVPDPLSHAAARWWAGWPVLAVLVAALAVCVSLVRSHAKNTPASRHGLVYGLVLATIGLLTALVPELAYVHDDFESRTNTVFKFYYQAWLFLGLAGAAGVTLAWRKGGAARSGAVVSLALLMSGLVYAPVATLSKVRSSRAASGSFDALAHLERERADESAAIAWVRSNTRPGAIIAQAPGNSYDVMHGLISTATARPTLLGWEGHERQWRGRAFDGMAAGRHEGLASIYAPASDLELQQALLAWNVAYVYVGPLERRRYAISAADEERLNRTMDLVFDRGAVRIYRRRG